TGDAVRVVFCFGAVAGGARTSTRPMVMLIDGSDSLGGSRKRCLRRVVVCWVCCRCLVCLIFFVRWFVERGVGLTFSISWTTDLTAGETDRSGCGALLDFSVSGPTGRGC